MVSGEGLSELHVIISSVPGPKIRPLLRQGGDEGVVGTGHWVYKYECKMARVMTYIEDLRCMYVYLQYVVGEKKKGSGGGACVHVCHVYVYSEGQNYDRYQSIM